MPDLFNDLDNLTKDPREIIRAPFGYPGGKSRSAQYILPLLPYRNTYVEPFGGAGTILLSRGRSKLEVYNDRYSGVVAFYRVLRDPEKYKELVRRLEQTVYSREEWSWCRETWENCSDDVERAARWFYMLVTSFNKLGRTFGRSTNSTYKHSLDLSQFQPVHERLQGVLIENLDWYDCLQDFDSPETIFYCDPPYLDAYKGTYKHELNKEEHSNFLNAVFQCKGFVAVSGYTNPLYEEQDWDSRHTWESIVSARSQAYSERNHKKDLENVDDTRSHATEVLWIKEAK